MDGPEQWRVKEGAGSKFGQGSLGGRDEGCLLQTDLNGRPEQWGVVRVDDGWGEVECGRRTRMIGLFGFTSALTLTFARRVRGAGLRWGIFTFDLVFHLLPNFTSW